MIRIFGETRVIPCADSAESLYWREEAVGQPLRKNTVEFLPPPVFRTSLNSATDFPKQAHGVSRSKFREGSAS